MKNKTFNIICPNKKANATLIEKIKSAMNKSKLIYSSSNPDYLFIVGGDGAFVRNIKKFYSNNKVHIIPVNGGNVGFYSSFDAKHLPKAKDILKESNYIQNDVISVNVGNRTFNAINECTIKTLNTISCDIYINDSFYESYRGSGLLIATKTGSTGFCKSALGSIILPTVDAYEMVELFPTLHAKKNTIGSPIILDARSTITLKNIKSNYANSLVCDGIEECSITTTQDINIKITKSNFRLYSSNDNDKYINKLQKTFIKG